MKNLFKIANWCVVGIIVEAKNIIVNYKFDARFGCTCSRCGERMKKHMKKQICNVLDLPVLDKETRYDVETIQFRCPQCGKFHTPRPALFHPTKNYTWRFMEKISREHFHAPADFVAEETGISESTVRRIDREVLAETLPPPNNDNLEKILVDEKYLGAQKGFVTLVINAKTGEPVALNEGKNKISLDVFFKNLTPEQRAKILCVGIDRGNAFRVAIEENIPHAKICYDPFHLVSNFNEIVDSVRRSEFLSVPAEIKELICGNRYLLLKSPEKLSVPAQEKLALLLKSNETLNKTYLLKEQFRAIFKIKDALEAQLALVSWIKMAFKSGISRVQKFARKIELHFRQIANAFVYKVNSGKIEATNATLKRIISKACGVSDVDYLFLKLRQDFYFCRARFFSQPE